MQRLIKAPSLENTELTNVHPLMPGIGQNRVMHASSALRNFFLVHSLSIFTLIFLQILSFIFNCVTPVSSVGPQNRSPSS